MLRLASFAACLLALSSTTSCERPSPPASPPPLAHQAAALDQRFVELRLATERIVESAAELERHPEAYVRPLYPERHYKFFDNSLYYSVGEDNKGSVMASGFHPVDDALKKSVRRLEHLEPVLRRETSANHWIAMSWFANGPDVAVFDPPFDLVAFVPPRINIEEDIMPYKLAAQTVPPGRPVWLEPYVDITGKGYVTTVSVPLVLEGRLAGVAGVDISLKHLAETLSRPEFADRMLVSRDFYVIATGKTAAELLRVAALGDHYYLSRPEKDVPAPEGFRLHRQSAPWLTRLAEELTRDATRVDLTVEGKSLEAHVTLLPETGWRLLEIRQRRE